MGRLRQIPRVTNMGGGRYVVHQVHLRAPCGQDGNITAACGLPKPIMADDARDVTCKKCLRL